MSRADALFLQNCRDILDHGVWDTDLPVRPHWAVSYTHLTLPTKLEV